MKKLVFEMMPQLCPPILFLKFHTLTQIHSKKRKRNHIGTIDEIYDNKRKRKDIETIEEYYIDYLVTKDNLYKLLET